MTRYRLSTRDRQAGRFREVVTVEAETSVDALKIIREGPHQLVLAFARSDVRLERVDEYRQTIKARDV